MLAAEEGEALSVFMQIIPRGTDGENKVEKDTTGCIVMPGLSEK